MRYYALLCATMRYYALLCATIRQRLPSWNPSECITPPGSILLVAVLPGGKHPAVVGCLLHFDNVKAALDARRADLVLRLLRAGAPLLIGAAELSLFRLLRLSLLLLLLRFYDCYDCYDCHV